MSHVDSGMVIKDIEALATVVKAQCPDLEIVKQKTFKNSQNYIYVYEAVPQINMSNLSPVQHHQRSWRLTEACFCVLHKLPVRA